VDPTHPLSSSYSIHLSAYPSRFKKLTKGAWKGICKHHIKKRILSFDSKRLSILDLSKWTDYFPSDPFFSNSLVHVAGSLRASWTTPTSRIDKNDHLKIYSTQSSQAPKKGLDWRTPPSVFGIAWIPMSSRTPFITTWHIT